MSQAERGHVAYKKETIWGQVAEPATKVWMMENEALIQNIEDILSKAHRGVVAKPASYQGLRTFGGPMAFEVHPDNYGDILRSLIYAPVTDAAASVINVLDDCETNWVSHVECISVLDTVDFKVGSKSVKIYVPADVADGTIIATRAVTLVDMTADDEIVLWMKSSINLDASDLKFVIDEEAACASPDESIAIDTALTAGVWTRVTITLPDMSAENAVISIGIEMDVNKGEFILNLDDINRVDTAGAAGTAKDHVFTPSNDDFHADCPLYPYTLEAHKDQAAAEAFQFLGAVANRRTLSFGANDKILHGVVDWIAKDIDRVAKTAIAFPLTNPFTWNQAVIKIAGVQNDNLESVNIVYDNHLVGVPTLNGTYIIKRLYRSGHRTVDLNFVIDFTDQIQYDLWVSGTEQSFQIVFTGAVTADAGYYYTYTIDIPAMKYKTFPIPNPGSGRLSIAVAGNAEYSIADGYEIKETLRNCTASY